MRGIWIAAGVSGLASAFFIFGGWWLRKRLVDWETEQDNWDTSVDLGSAEDLAFDEAEHVKALRPTLTFVPDGFTCLRCYENPALQDKVFCAVCDPIVRRYPAEPIERGQR